MKIFFILLMLSTLTLAQKNWVQVNDSTKHFQRKIDHNNIVFIEGLGNGIGLSLNYERYLNNYFSIRVGYGFTSNMHNIPLMFNFNLYKIHLEFGLGTIAYIGESIGAPKNNNILLTSSFGFKFIFKDLLLKATLNPYVSLKKDGSSEMDVIPYFGLSFGVLF